MAKNSKREAFFLATKYTSAEGKEEGKIWVVMAVIKSALGLFMVVRRRAYKTII